jgi:hypothetical protein
MTIKAAYAIVPELSEKLQKCASYDECRCHYFACVKEAVSRHKSIRIDNLHILLCRLLQESIPVTHILANSITTFYWNPDIKSRFCTSHTLDKFNLCTRIPRGRSNKLCDVHRIALCARQRLLITVFGRGVTTVIMLYFGDSI